jgi:MarR family transcriptional regulator, organic hydroperoxide resistance regulator
VTGLAGLVRERAQDAGRELGLSPPAVMALAQLAGSMSMGELGQRLGCERSFITAIADELEGKALIRRELDPADRRHRNIVLTGQGSAMRARLEAEFFGRLPWRQALDDQQRASLLGLLTAVLDAGRDGARPAARDARPKGTVARPGEPVRPGPGGRAVVNRWPSPRFPSARRAPPPA